MNVPYYATEAARLLRQQVEDERHQPSANDRNRGLVTIEQASASRRRRRLMLRAGLVLGLLTLSLVILLIVGGRTG